MSQTIPLNAFLNAVEAIARTCPTYQLGHDGSDGGCDCIGLVIGALRRAGGHWSGTHGSNYAARQEIDRLSPIRSAQDLSPGEIVFKAANPGQSPYNLPARYANSPDQRDYYHAGIVTFTTPLTITHCTGPGILRDTRLGKWNYHGWLHKLSPEGGTPMQATITASSGSTVNLRDKPNGALQARLPVGATVTVLAQQDGWVQVSYQDQTGWMMEKFVAAASDSVSIALPRSTAQALFSALEAALGRG